MGIVVMPITRVVGVDPTIKVPWSFGIADKTFVASAQVIAANLLDRLSMASFWVLSESSTLVHADRDVQSS